ncbi:MAG: hypothetical protein GY847_15870 [Proteobacteria bacterium]|nr:hypothetical protein [Pseudomonadota bacterium]
MSNTHQEIEQQVAAFLDARKRRPKHVKVIDKLDSLRSIGRDHLRAWTEIYRAFKGDERELIALAGWFFVISAVAHLQTAVLHAAKLTERNKDSVNVWYLLNLVESMPGSRELRHGIKTSVRNCRERLEALEGDLAKIKEQRDLHLAHVDRNKFNTDIEQGVVAAEVLERIFDEIGEVLKNIGSLVPEVQQVAAAEEDSPQVANMIGPRGLADLFYFARIAVRDAEVLDPSDNSKRIRDFERALRKGERDSRTMPVKAP